MFRFLGTVLKDNTKVAASFIKASCLQSHSTLKAQVRCLGILAKQFDCQQNLINQHKGTNILSNSLNKLLLPDAPLSAPCRTVTKYSLSKGKRKSVKTVLKRFYRLHWGGWIRTRAGRHKHLWKKSEQRRRKLRQHVFCNATQSWMLDRMTTKFWRRRRWYVDDPYEPYHTREELPETKRKPAPWIE